MNVVIDIECNALVNPTEIWLIVCKEVESGLLHLFRNVTSNDTELNRFLEFVPNVDRWIGHNVLGYDAVVIDKLLNYKIYDKSLDTLILSRLIDYPRTGGHSVESYGEEFGIEKGTFSKWGDEDLYNPLSALYEELVTYCVRDVEITLKVYQKYLKYISKEEHKASITLEHKFQLICNDLSNNGFKLNVSKAKDLLEKTQSKLSVLDAEIEKAFPPKLKLVREIHPKETKHGTLSKTDFRWVTDGDLSIYNGGPFSRCVWTAFNPSSPKQIVDVLNAAGWRPTDKTKTHIALEREVNREKYRSKGERSVDLADDYVRLEKLKKYGWKVNEANLATLPEDAPAAARTLAQRILLESRRRTLTEWLDLVQPDGRIHGKFYGIGAWTHRMAHQQPNTANIPNEFDTEGRVKLLGKEMRQLWCAPKNRLLVGVDAEGIQLRVFAHYINDPEFTEALVKGKKSDKTDPHSLNQRILGPACKTRAAAKRFIYALLLGGAVPKLAEILAASEDEARRALDRLLERYEGFARLKAEVIPADAKRGWFTGLDGRAVRIPGETTGERKHLCMSGYLQNGEAIIMKMATLRWYDEIDQSDGLLLSQESPIVLPRREGPITSGKIKLVNFVHDEWQTETPNNMELAIRVAECQSRALQWTGEQLKLKCPLAGSYWNEDHNDYTIGTNWYATH